ncbi:MAG: RCC1 domain-containing protein [Cetobacterium sp.]
MFLKTKDMMTDLTEMNKVVASKTIGDSIAGQVGILFENSQNVQARMDSLLSEYNNMHLKNDGMFPVENPKIGGKYMYNGVIYKLIGKKPYKKITSGGHSTVILEQDGTMYSYGMNTSGQLGLGYVTPHERVPVKIPLDPFGGDKIVDIEMVAHSLYFLGESGSVYVVGNNDKGQLGTGNTTTVTIPTKVPFDFEGKRVKKMVVGGAMASANTVNVIYWCDDDTLFACGHNDAGQLGIGITTQQNSIVKVLFTPSSPIKDVVSGGYSTTATTFVLLENNQIYWCGYNGVNTSGIALTTNILSLTLHKELSLPEGSTITHISTGAGATMLVLDNKHLYAAGYCGNYLHGNGSTANKKSFTFIKTFEFGIRKVVIDGYGVTVAECSCVVLLENGEVYCAGWNNNRMPTGIPTSGYFCKATFFNGKKIIDMAFNNYRAASYVDEDGYVIAAGQNHTSCLGIAHIDNATILPSLGNILTSYTPRNQIKSEYTVPDEDFIKYL